MSSCEFVRKLSYDFDFWTGKRVFCIEMQLVCLALCEYNLSEITDGNLIFIFLFLVTFFVSYKSINNILLSSNKRTADSFHFNCAA